MNQLHNILARTTLDVCIQFICILFLLDTTISWRFRSSFVNCVDGCNRQSLSFCPHTIAQHTRWPRGHITGYKRLVYFTLGHWESGSPLDSFHFNYSCSSTLHSTFCQLHIVSVSHSLIYYLILVLTISILDKILCSHNWKKILLYWEIIRDNERNINTTQKWLIMWILFYTHCSTVHFFLIKANPNGEV